MTVLAVTHNGSMPSAKYLQWQADTCTCSEPNSDPYQKHAVMRSQMLGPAHPDLCGLLAHQVEASASSDLNARRAPAVMCGLLSGPAHPDLCLAHQVEASASSDVNASREPTKALPSLKSTCLLVPLEERLKVCHTMARLGSSLSRRCMANQMNLCQSGELEVCLRVLRLVRPYCWR